MASFICAHFPKTIKHVSFRNLAQMLWAKCFFCFCFFRNLGYSCYLDRTAWIGKKIVSCSYTCAVLKIYIFFFLVRQIFIISCPDRRWGGISQVGIIKRPIETWTSGVWLYIWITIYLCNFLCKYIYIFFLFSATNLWGGKWKFVRGCIISGKSDSVAGLCGGKHPCSNCELAEGWTGH